MTSPKRTSFAFAACMLFSILIHDSHHNVSAMPRHSAFNSLHSSTHSTPQHFERSDFLYPSSSSRQRLLQSTSAPQLTKDFTPVQQNSLSQERTIHRKRRLLRGAQSLGSVSSSSFVVSPISPSSSPSPLPSPLQPAAPSVNPSAMPPQNQLNTSQSTFPFTPLTGANNSLELTPNVTSIDRLVEIRIGVLLPYSLPNNLTQQLAYSGTSAIRLAVSEINANHLIPGAYVTLVLKDSFNGLDPENSGAAQAIFSTVSLLQTNGGVSGVIGDVSSALTLQSALLTSRLSIPQCSYSAGSTQLTDKDDYSYFFRTIPTELMFGTVMMDFVANRGWKTVAVFYTGDSLGSQMMDNIDIEASKRGITVGYRRAFWEMGASSDVGPALDALEDSGQRVIIIAAVSVPQYRLIVEAVNKGLVSKDYVWLAISQITEPLLDEYPTLKPADLNGLFMFDNLLKLSGYPPYEMFLNKWEALDPAQYPYAGQRDISSNEPQAYSCMMVMARAFANATKGNGTALNLLADGKLSSVLSPTDMNVNYIGPGGPMVFDERGDVIYGNFILYNFQNGEVIPIGTSYSGVFNLSSAPMYFDGTHDTPADSAPLQVINPKFGSPIGLVVISVAGLSILFSLLTMMIVVMYRRAQVIKASSPLFCCLELCGFILLYIATIMGLDIPNNIICMARPLTLNVGFVLVVSNIVAKNFRVYRIFHNIYVTKRVIKDAHLLKIVGTILVGNLIIMAFWFFKTPPALVQITGPDFTSYWTCDNASGNSIPFFVLIFIYNAALLLVATYLAYMNRNVAANYNECRQIAFVVYNILLSGCLAVPTVFLPQNQFLTKFYLSTVVILFGTTFSLMFLFLPKLWELFTQIERSQNRGNDTSRVNGSDEGSVDGIIYNGAAAGWMNSSGNLAILGQGAVGALGSANGSNSHLAPDGRKGSVTTLDDPKGGDTLKETHMGYMSIKFQNRYLPFLSSWGMRRVALYPAGRYFTCFEVGKPETGKTYTYTAAMIDSRVPGAFILRIIGCSRYDFLLQVRDEERLLYWFSLFENYKPGHQQQHQPSNAYSSSTRIGTIFHLGNLSLANISPTNVTPPPLPPLPMNASSLASPVNEEIGNRSWELPDTSRPYLPENEHTLRLVANHPLAYHQVNVQKSGDNAGTNSTWRHTQMQSAPYEQESEVVGYDQEHESSCSVMTLTTSLSSAGSGGEQGRTVVDNPCRHGGNAAQRSRGQLIWRIDPDAEATSVIDLGSLACVENSGHSGGATELRSRQQPQQEAQF